MSTRAVLFDLGNTLIDYYRGPESHPILLDCLRRADDLVGGTVNREELFLQALELNREAPDLAVRPLANRLIEMFPTCADRLQGAVEDISRAFMAPIFACAKVNEAAVEVLAALRGHGIKTGIVSNTPWGQPGCAMA